jgi:pilus assembly protein Flp/PilA
MGAAGNSLKYKSIHFTELKETKMTSLMVSMTAFIAGIRERFESEKGATATEYSLLVGLIALVIVAGVTLFGGNLNTFFNGLAGKVGAW